MSSQFTDYLDEAAKQVRVSASVSLPATVAVSGTLMVGNSPDVGQTRGPWAVSGTVTVSNAVPVTIPNPLGVSGMVVIAPNQPPVNVSGSVIISGGSIKTDKTAFTEGTSTFTPVGGVFNDSLGADLTEDTNGAVRMTARRAQHVNLRDSSGSEIGTTLAPLAVSGLVRLQEKAVAHGANPTAVTAGLPVDAVANRAGVPFVIGGHPNPICLRANYLGTQTDTAVVAGAGGQIIVVTSFMVTVDAGASGSVGARLGFGTSNTPTGVGVVGSHPGIAAGSGYGRGSGAGILGAGTDGQALRLTTTAVPGGNGLDVNLTYFVIES